MILVKDHAGIVVMEPGIIEDFAADLVDGKVFTLKGETMTVTGINGSWKYWVFDHDKAMNIYWGVLQ